MPKWDAPYVPSTWGWVSNQVEEFEASGGAEGNTWWDRSVAAYPPYADYAVTAADANREIPVFVARPVV